MRMCRREMLPLQGLTQTKEVGHPGGGGCYITTKPRTWGSGMERMLLVLVPAMGGDTLPGSWLGTVGLPGREVVGLEPAEPLQFHAGFGLLPRRGNGADAGAVAQQRLRKLRGAAGRNCCCRSVN